MACQPCQKLHKSKVVELHYLWKESANFLRPKWRFFTRNSPKNKTLISDNIQGCTWKGKNWWGFSFDPSMPPFAARKSKVIQGCQGGASRRNGVKEWQMLNERDDGMGFCRVWGVYFFWRRGRWGVEVRWLSRSKRLQGLKRRVCWLSMVWMFSQKKKGSEMDH